MTRVGSAVGPVRRRQVVLGLGLGGMIVAPAWAKFPDRPVKLIVPFAPGGGTDAITRELASGMAVSLGLPVVVDNKPGAGTLIGTDWVAKSPADGHALVMATFAHAVNPSLYAKLPFDFHKAFAPVSLVAHGPNVLVVRSDSALRQFGDVLDFASAHPDELSYASQGNGTSAHLAGEMLCHLGRLKLKHIPYRGAGLAMMDLLGNQVNMMFATAAAVAPHIRQGKLRALAVTSSERWAAQPELPSIAEQVPGYQVESWYGLLAPAGTPEEAIATLQAAVAWAAGQEKFKLKMASEGLTISAGPPQELAAYIQREAQRWQRLVKDHHIHID
jgi:tripartite-type tricarboxylate transporter receptor subunit TctC